MKIKYDDCTTTVVPKHIGYSKFIGFARFLIIFGKVNKTSINSRNINNNLFSIEEETFRVVKIFGKSEVKSTPLK